MGKFGFTDWVMIGLGLIALVVELWAAYNRRLGDTYSARVLVWGSSFSGPILPCLFAGVLGHVWLSTYAVEPLGLDGWAWLLIGCAALWVLNKYLVTIRPIYAVAIGFLIGCLMWPNLGQLGE